MSSETRHYQVVRFADLDGGRNGDRFAMGREALGSAQLGVTWIELPPGRATQGDRGHYHDVQDEVYVLADGGPLQLRVEQEEVTLHRGEAIKVDARAVHALRNAGSETALVIAMSGIQPPEGDDSHPVDDFWAEAG